MLRLLPRSRVRTVITAQTIDEAFAAGHASVAAPRGECVVTPAAWSRASELRVTIDQGPSQVAGPSGRPHTQKIGSGKPGQGKCERIVDPSGLVVVRGRSVKLGEFTGAGPGRHIGLTDVVSGGDGAPMAAGFMSWSREDSFPWSLDYAEIDLVLEGILHITIDGRTLEGRPGDVVYLPKGSRIVFGTPSRVRLFYVTYPANWSGGTPG